MADLRIISSQSLPDSPEPSGEASWALRGIIAYFLRALTASDGNHSTEQASDQFCRLVDELSRHSFSPYKIVCSALNISRDALDEPRKRMESNLTMEGLRPDYYLVQAAEAGAAYVAAIIGGGQRCELAAKQTSFERAIKTWQDVRDKYQREFYPQYVRQESSSALAELRELLAKKPAKKLAKPKLALE